MLTAVVGVSVLGGNVLGVQGAIFGGVGVAVASFLIAL